MFIKYLFILLLIHTTIINIIGQPDIQTKDNYYKECKEPSFHSASTDINKLAQNDSTHRYEFHVKTFNTLQETLIKAADDDKLVIVFFFPSSDKENFDQFIKNYEANISSLMNDSYNQKYDPVYVYRMLKTENDLIKTYNLSTDQMIVLTPNGEVIYKQLGDLNTLSEEFSKYILDNTLEDITNTYLMKRLDQAVQFNEYNEQKIQKIFHEISQISTTNFFSGYYSLNDKSYKFSQRQNKDITFYPLKSNKKEIDHLFKKLVNSHDSDLTVDVQYASIISKFLHTHYDFILYLDFDHKLNNSDLKSMDYLLNFNDYLKTQERNNADLYIFEIEKTITKILIEAAPSASKQMLQAIKPRLKKVNLDQNIYLNFVRQFIPEDYLTEYKIIYDAYQFKDKDPVLTLNDIYKNEQHVESWNAYKKDVSIQANDAAKFIAEDNSNKQMIKEALKWSKTSLNIEENNPYYLNTYAQLLYKNGDNEIAIKFQTKAVKIISDNPHLYKTSLLKKSKEVLSKMKLGSY